MPKRKNRPRGPLTSDERRARGERIVHREEMRTSLGDVLESEHVDEAIRLLYRRDELGGENAQPTSPSADHADKMSTDDADAPKNVREPSATAPPAERARVRRWRFAALSPAALWRASVAALGEISAGAQHARDDLTRAMQKAASTFRGELQAP